MSCALLCAKKYKISAHASEPLILNAKAHNHTFSYCIQKVECILCKVSLSQMLKSLINCCSFDKSHIQC